MGKQFILLCFLFLGTHIYSPFCYGATRIKSQVVEPICGRFLIGDGGKMYFKKNEKDRNGTLYLIIPPNEKVAPILKRLKNNDILNVTGEIDLSHPKDPKIRIDNIERIGLNRLLGSWSIKEEGTIIVLDSSHITFLSDNVIRPAIGDCESNSSNSELQLIYSVAPENDNDDEWILFLTYCSKTLYGKIRIMDNEILLKIFDNNGNLEKEATLVRNR